MDISVVIPSYNSEKTIGQCLQSILNQNTNFTYEIILVDSSPGSKVDNVVTTFPKVKFIKLKNKTYAGIARNIGANNAQGELLLFIDSDIVVPKNWFENAIKYYKSGHNVFSGSIDLWRHKKVNVLGKLEWFFEQSEFKPLLKEDTKRYLPSTALAIKKEIFDTEKFTDMQVSEDIDLTIRLRKRGNILYFNPELKVFHISHCNWAEMLWKAFNFGLCNVENRKRHNLAGSYFVRRPILCFFVIPGFAIIKLIRISWRNLRYNTLTDKILYLILFPGVLLLILVWMLGFYIGWLTYQ